MEELIRLARFGGEGMQVFLGQAPPIVWAGISILLLAVAISIVVRSYARLTAVRGDIIKKILRAFDFGDDGRARRRPQNLARKQNHQFIAPDDASRLIDHADPIAIAIERETDVRVVCMHGGDRVL